MLTIAWDVDDVLNNLAYEWLNYFCKKYNKKISYEDLVINPPCEIIGVSREEYSASLDEFRLSEAALNMEPDKNILCWMEKSGNKFHHIALSATSAQTARNGAYWVMKNFYKYIHSYNIVPSYRANDKVLRPFQNKGEFIESLKFVDVLVDDNEHNIKDAVSAGAQGFLVKRPWNKGGLEIPEILEKLERL